MTLAVARFTRVLAISAMMFGIAGALRPASLLAQVRANILTTAVVLPAQAAQEANLTALATGARAARLFDESQPAVQNTVTGPSGLVTVSAQPVVAAERALVDARRQRSVRVLVEFTAN